MKLIKKDTVQFHIHWEEYDNSDIGGENYSGWYIDLTLGGDLGDFQIGPDAFDPGLKTVEEAIAVCRKWAEDRGYRFIPPTGITAAATKRSEVDMGEGRE